MREKSTGETRTRLGRISSRMQGTPFLRAALSRVLLPPILAAALAACGPDVSAPDGEPYVTSFDRLWTTVDRQYSYFPLKQVDWDSVRRIARPRAQALVSEEAFIALATEVLAELRDVHVWLLAPDGTAHGTWQPDAVANWSPPMLDRLMAEGSWVDEAPGLGHRDIGGIPYIALRTWNALQLTAEDFDRALERYRDAPALILDARMNPGGSDALAMQVAARFADVSRVVTYYQYRDGPRHGDFTPLTPRRLEPRGAWRFTRPVILLVGRGSWSSTESFVSAMRELPHVTVVGDTTGGGSGNPALFALRGGWGVSVSRWVEYTAQMEIIEGRGIAPDVALPVSPEAVAEGRDDTLDAALDAALALTRGAATTRSARSPG